MQAASEGIGLSPAGARVAAVALRRMEDLEAEIAPLRSQIAAFARRQPGCQALKQQLFGAGLVVAAVVWAFLGATRRFSLLRPGRPAHRARCPRVLLRQQAHPRAPMPTGPPILCRTLFEAGHQASRAVSPDYRYYRDVAARIDANQAALSVARKLARLSCHILRRLGDTAYATSQLDRYGDAGAPGGPAHNRCTVANPAADAPVRLLPPSAPAPADSLLCSWRT